MPAAGLLRRLGAIVYDSLLLLAVLFFATAIILPLNAGQAFSSEQTFFPAYLLLVSFLFFAWFWTHGGQTLGMRAWKIKITALDGKPIDWPSAAIRFMAAILSWSCVGAGFWWSLFDPQQQCWHDKLSKTRLLRTTREKNGPAN